MRRSLLKRKERENGRGASAASAAAGIGIGIRIGIGMGIGIGDGDGGRRGDRLVLIEIRLGLISEGGGEREGRRGERDDSNSDLDLPFLVNRHGRCKKVGDLCMSSYYSMCFWCSSAPQLDV